ncbi:SDR family NAD(P)-dependent oxidoreductase [Pseudoroseicyclus sp. H15]
MEDAPMSRTIVITGASDGIGAKAAGMLKEAGNDVIVVGRSPDKTRKVAEAIDAPYLTADYAKLDDVRWLATELAELRPRIDVLANNAGGIFSERELTVDGFEKTMQINHLAPFLLTNLLMPKLIESGASVIQTASTAARFAGKVDLDDLNLEKRYSPVAAYNRSKLLNVLVTRELHRRYHAQGISTACFHPGVIASNFAAESRSPMGVMFQNPIIRRIFTTSPEVGASRLVFLAQGEPGRDWEPGRYYERNKPARRENRQASNAALASGLWERSEEMAGLTVAA